jgi:hypothetical protein
MKEFKEDLGVAGKCLFLAIMIIGSWGIAGLLIYLILEVIKALMGR